MRGALVAAAVLACSGCPGFHRGPLPGAPADDSYLEIDGVTLRYDDTGPADAPGPTVVLIHGYGSSLEAWDEIAPALARDHRVVSVDLKGFGWSSRPPGDYSPAAHAELVWKLLDRRGAGGPVAVVGHSWGASVALAMALERPARVDRIALVSAYVYEGQVPSFFRWARVGGLGEMLFALYYRERLEERVPLAFYDPERVDQAMVDRVEAILDRPGAVAAALATARGQRYRAVETRYASIEVPALIVWGREDAITPLSFGERLARDLPESELVVIPRCGHIPMAEATAATRTALLEFLAPAAEPASGGNAPGSHAP